MRKKQLKVLCVLFALLVTVTLAVPSIPAEAKGKSKVRYYSALCFVDNSNESTARMGYIKKISFKKGKVIIRGTLEKSKKKSSDKYTLLKDKKRTFKLAKKVKIRQGAGGTDKLGKISKKEAQKSINRHQVFQFEMKVKNGRVTEITLLP